MTTPLTILVTGATGNQGGAVAHTLLSKGYKVRALTRNTTSAAAKGLEKQGAEVIACNFDDTEGLAKALQGVDTFYLMSTPFEAGVEAETRQGINLADAAKKAGVGHLIYSSVANADKKTEIPHFDSKYKVEQHIKMLGIPYTVSAPVYFMENVMAPWSIDAFKTGKIMRAMPGNRMLQQVSLSNIGEFVSCLVSRRESVFGQRIDIAGDELNGYNTARILSQVIGHPIQHESVPVSTLREQSEDMATMFEWFDNVGYSVDMKALRQDFPEVRWQNYQQWADCQDWDFMRVKKMA